MHRLDLIQDMKKASQIMQEKVFLVVMTSSMTSQGDLKVAPLYSLINEKLTFSVITEKRTTISSLNLVSIGIISLWIEFWQVRNRQIALSMLCYFIHITLQDVIIHTHALTLMSVIVSRHWISDSIRCAYNPHRNWKCDAVTWNLAPGNPTLRHGLC